MAVFFILCFILNIIILFYSIRNLVIFKKWYKEKTEYLHKLEQFSNQIKTK